MESVHNYKLGDLKKPSVTSITQENGEVCVKYTASHRYLPPTSGTWYVTATHTSTGKQYSNHGGYDSGKKCVRLTAGTYEMRVGVVGGTESEPSKVTVK